MKKILIIYTSIGLGHKVVAENIASELKKTEGLEVGMLDILKFYGGGLVSGYSQLYEKIVRKLPWLWRFFYTSRIFTRLTLPLRGLIAGRKANKLASYLSDSEPDLILTTQTTATALVSHLKNSGDYKGKLVVAFSDYHFHPYWVYPGVDKFLLNIPEQKQGIVKYGYKESDGAVVGLPVDGVFSNEIDRSEFLGKYDLTYAKPVVLVMGGSRGWGISIEDIKELLRSTYDIQLIVLCGSNDRLYDSLGKLESDYKNLRILRTVPNTEVAGFYSLAHHLVSKPGGLTSAQAIMAEVPMIFINPFPGMEEQNMKYLETQGAGVSASSSQEVLRWNERLFADPDYYNQLVENVRRLKRPAAASLAAQEIIDLL